MTFYFKEDENDFEGNRIGAFAELDGSTLTIDVDGIMEEGRGVRKLEEMINQIEMAIEANTEPSESPES